MINFIYKKRFIILFLIILAGLFLRIYPFETKSWITNFNAQVVNQALALGQGLAEKDFSFLSQKIEYPFFIPSILLLGYGIFYFIGVCINLFSSVPEFISYLFLHLNELYWYSRILIGIFGSLSVLLVYLTVKRVFYLNQKKKIILGSLLSAFLLSFSLLNVQFSQQIRPHVAVSFFILLSFYCYLIVLKKKTIGSYLILAVSCGLSASILISGFFTFIFLILANYFITFQSSKLRLSNLVKSFFSGRFLAGLGVFGALILIFYPFFFFSSLSERFYFFEQGEGLFISLGSSPFPIANLGLGFITILKGLFFQEPALGILLIFFLFFYFFKRKPIDGKNFYYKQSLIGWWLFVIPYTLIFILLDNGTRYRVLSPLVVFLCLGLGILFVRGFNNLSKHKKISLLLISILLLFEFTQAFRLVELISRPYTAEIATKWIEKNISLEETIIYQGFLPGLIPDKESIKINFDLSGLLGYRNQYLLSLEAEEYPLEGRSMINFNHLLEYQGNDIPKTLEYLKKIRSGYLISALHPSEEEKNTLPIYQIAEKQGHLIKSFSPYDEPNKRALTFPSGMNNPIIDLWQAKYLGPKVDIYKFDWNDE